MQRVSRERLHREGGWVLAPTFFFPSYGAKLCNVFSKKFTVETANKKKGKKFKQTWTENMTKAGDHKIKTDFKGSDYTRITFQPEFNRFHMAGISARFFKFRT